MRTTNPLLNEKAFSNAGSYAADAMTVNGTIQKTAALLFLAICSAAYTWTVTRVDGGSAAIPWAMGGAIGGLICVLAIYFKPVWAPILAPAYALLEGLFLGAISAILEAQFHGIVLTAAMLTMGTLGVMLFVYRMGWVKATEKFKTGVMVATGAIMLVYLVSMVLRLFSREIPFIHEGGAMGIGFSLLVVGIAALNLILDFDFIEKGSEQGAPRYMEWVGAVGLLVTLVWLYIEILRLLSKLNRSR
jgi:uncharacterized YccA/Bax inhibitor family protein